MPCLRGKHSFGMSCHTDISKNGYRQAIDVKLSEKLEVFLGWGRWWSERVSINNFYINILRYCTITFQRIVPTFTVSDMSSGCLIFASAFQHKTFPEFQDYSFLFSS